MAQVPPIGFWSYSTRDDDLSGGKLSELRDRVTRELELQYGHGDIKMFEMSKLLPSGDIEREVFRALAESTFFIPVLTPNYIKGQWCSREVTFFLERERTLQARYPDLSTQSLIFPIEYVEIRESDAFDPRVLMTLKARQWLQFRTLRHKETNSPEVLKATADFASAICELLRRKLDGVPETGSDREHRSSGTSTTRELRPAQARIVLSLAPAAIQGVKALLGDQQERLHNGPPEAIEEENLRALRELHEALGILIQLAESDQDLSKQVGVLSRLSRQIFGIAQDTGELCVAGFKPLLASMPAAWGTWALLGMICSPGTFAMLGPAAAVGVTAGYFGLELKRDQAKTD